MKKETGLEGEVSTSELAAIIGKTPQWVRQLTRDRILSQVARGKYRLSDAVQAYILHVSGGKEEDDKPRFIDHKTEHERIKSEIAALELAELQRNLHTTADVLGAWGELLVDFRGKLSSLPPRLATELTHMTDSKAIRILLEEKINDALRELAKYDPLASDDA
jgi:hypothetical protein